MVREDASQHGVPPTAGQVHVEQDHAGDAFVDELDGSSGLVRLAHHLDGVAQFGLDAGPEHGVILDEKDAGAAGDLPGVT